MVLAPTEPPPSDQLLSADSSPTPLISVSTQTSHCSRGTVLKLEELLETLQDRRRKVDQALRFQLQQVRNSTMRPELEEESGSEARDHIDIYICWNKTTRKEVLN